MKRLFFKCRECRQAFCVDIATPDGRDSFMWERSRVQLICAEPCPFCSHKPGARELNLFGGHEFLGVAGPSGARLYENVQRCPCDERCTHARRPVCECSCGGANHGSGCLVEVAIDCGPVPAVGQPLLFA